MDVESETLYYNKKIKKNEPRNHLDMKEQQITVFFCVVMEADLSQLLLSSATAKCTR